MFQSSWSRERTAAVGAAEDGKLAACISREGTSASKTRRQAKASSHGDGVANASLCPVGVRPRRPACRCTCSAVLFDLGCACGRSTE